MKKKEIHIYAYKITNNNKDLFGEIKNPIQDTLQDTLLELSTQNPPVTKSIQHVDSQTNDKVSSIYKVKHEDDCYLIGYSTLNQNEGPAKGNVRGDYEAFGLKRGEGYALMSAALYQPCTGAFLTTNIRGTLSADDMLQLILSHDKESGGATTATPIPLINPDVQATLEKSSYCSSLEVTFYPSAMEDAFNNEGMSLYQFCLFNSNEVYPVEVKLSISKVKDTKGMEWLRSFANFFIGKNKDQVKKLKAGLISDTNDQHVNILDLLNAHVHSVAKVTVGKDRFIEHDTLFDALKKQLREWSNLYKKSK